DGAEARLALAEGGLGLLLRREVEGDADDADERAGLVVDGGVDDEGGERGAVPATELHLAAPAPARAQLLHDGGGLAVGFLGGRYVEDRATDGLLGGPAVERLGKPVPVDDPPLHVGG